MCSDMPSSSGLSEHSKAPTHTSAEANSTNPSPAPAKRASSRVYVRTACDRCRRCKRACDGQYPCVTCIRVKAVCNYNDITPCGSSKGAQSRPVVTLSTQKKPRKTSKLGAVEKVSKQNVKTNNAIRAKKLTLDVGNSSNEITRFVPPTLPFNTNEDKQLNEMRASSSIVNPFEFEDEFSWSNVAVPLSTGSNPPLSRCPSFSMLTRCPSLSNIAAVLGDDKNWGGVVTIEEPEWKSGNSISTDCSETQEQISPTKTEMNVELDVDPFLHNVGLV